MTVPISLGLLCANAAFCQPELTIRAGTNAVELTFPGTAGTTNQVQWIGTLGTTNWTVLTNVVLSSNQLVTVLDSGTTTATSRFYRLVISGSSETKETILSNLGNPDGTGENDQIMSGGNAATRIRMAVGFTIGSNSQTGRFEFTIRANNPASLNELGLRLVNDNAGVPGSSIAFVNPAPTTTVPGGGLGYTLSWDGTLNANTVYWLVASVESTLVSHSYTWIDRGPYVENGASFFQAQAEAFGGWNEIEAVHLSLEVSRSNQE